MRPVLLLSLLVVLLARGALNLDEEKLASTEEKPKLESAEADEQSGPRSYTYEQGVQAYLEEDWDACVQAFRYLLHRYKKYKSAIISCRKKCRSESEEFIPIFRENVEDLHFYEKKIKETLCIIKCNQEYREKFGRYALKRMSQKEEWKFITAEPYEYLHNCYYKTGYYQDAADAVFTFLIHNPEHKPSKLSLAHYMSLPEVDNRTIRSLTAEPYVFEYIKGIKAYEQEFFEEAALRLETSLAGFMESEGDCRTYCEGPFNQEWYPDFVTSLSNHFMYVANCKRRCPRLLSNLNGEFQKGFLDGHFNYLQFAYYKIGDLKRACEAVESYLLFNPADETMLANKKYYQSLPKIKEDYFTPRKEIIDYVKRQEYEKRLLLYVSEEFIAFDNYITNYESEFKEGPEQNEAKELFFMNKFYKLQKESSEDKTFAQNVKDLGGKSRFIKERLINQPKCSAIMHLAEMTTWEGDGYEDNISPHSKFERFEGVSLGRIAVLTYFGLVESSLLKLLLEVTEVAQKETERILKINKPLYPSYVHLACRTALPDSPVNRSDFSHIIHADNCLAENDGSCRSVSPAYVWRDYSSILYMNDNFLGGNFIFVKDKFATTVEATIRPRCGRMVIFSSGAENLHGVTALTRGKRCALGLWFTLRKKHRDLDRELAKNILRAVEEVGSVARNQGIGLDDVETYETYKSMLIRKFLINNVDAR